MSTLEERVQALEEQVIDLRQQVTDAHTLAAHADKDVAEFRQELRDQTKLINVTRLDMGTLREAVDTIRKTQVQHYAEHKADAAEQKAGMAQIVGLLNRIIDNQSGGQQAP